MYIVVRSDIPPGHQLAQAVHAAFQFSVEHPGLCDNWYRSSNYLVIVSVPDEDAMIPVVANAIGSDLPFSLVREPDIGDQITSLALPPGDASRKLCANFPLALRNTSSAVTVPP